MLLEFLVRAIGNTAPAPSQYGDNIRDDAIGYRRRPGSTVRGRCESGEFTFHYVHNDLGFRDTDHLPEKPVDTIRIVALGDSFTYGVGADFGDTYPSQVARRLNARPGVHRHVEMINLGLPRHFPALQLRTLERYGMAFDPDIVLVALLPNDVVDTQRGLDTVCLAESGHLIPCAAMRWSTPAVWIYLHSALGRIALRAWASPSGGGTIDPMEARSRGDDGSWEEAWRTMEGDLERIHQLALAHGATLVLVALPQRPPWGDAELYPETRLARWSAAHTVDFIPTLAALRAVHPEPPLYWAIDGHCTPRGYDVIADTIAAGLIARGLAP